MLDVIVKSVKISIWPILAALLVGIVLVSPANALRVNFAAQGDADKITFSFDSGKLPDVKVRRTAEEQLVVSFPASVWESESKPGSKDFPGKLVKSIRAVGNGIQLDTKTKAFGFIKVPVPGKPQFVLQIYRDPIGARWKPRKPKPAPTAQVAVATPVSAQPQAVQKPAATPPAPAAPVKEATRQVMQVQQQMQKQPVQAAPQQKTQVQQSVGQPVQQVAPAPGGETELPPDNATGERKPFFSVPYSVRTEVAPPPGQGQVQSVSQQAVSSQSGGQVAPPPVSTEAETGVYPPSSELRFKAVNKMAEEVKFAELAGSSAGRAPVVGQVSHSVAQPVEGQASGQAGGIVGGVVAGQVDVTGAAGGIVAPPPASVSGDGEAGGSVAPPPGPQSVEPVAPAVQQVDGSAGGSVAPPPTVVEGAPPPEVTPEEAGEMAQGVSPPQFEQPIDTVQDEGEGASEPEPEAEKTDLAAEDGAMPETAQGADNATIEREQRLQELKNKLSEAQSMMFNGALAAALPLYEEILMQRDVPPEMLEETLYAVADIKKEMHKSELDEYFGEISQAYIEAMNSNTESNNVPRALLSLGLLNLRVGNFPEAKAYFKMLQEKYPDDDNIPSISYYWGEYYYKKGDYKKAADQFQYLIQTYPEHELVKDAAFYLADSLNRTGFIDQAFQIVDYIDKRWPDYYMENTGFLRLAGGIEMKLKKWPQAKNHFFTFYNLNPEADGADVALAHIGDIYVHEGEKKAAGVIYQKVVEEYPDQEGGLVAKMRLAEEGIYDEPNMSEMISVFNRPYNKRPEEIYKEIVNNHPGSPLAPIAQLKLAMLYAYTKRYPEALTAAQDFIEKYPDSPFINRARTLGDSVFVLAVPGMIEEERFGRIVRYWETYEFIGQKDTKVDDRTRLNVALSYWKVGQPAKSLKLLEPYLLKKPVPGISEEALGLAVNIYLDQLAWKEIADLVAMTKANWDLKPRQLRQLDYARAMSLQNLGDPNKALLMWAELAKDTKVEPAFRAYAMYYMAKAAMERQDLRKVFVYAQEALALLLQTKGDPEKIKDAVLMSIYATERSGRYNEALKWAKEYDRYIDSENPEWASTRFKLARIYRKAGAIEEWKQLLGDIIEKKPESLQAKLAKSALETYNLEKQTEQYAPTPQ